MEIYGNPISGYRTEYYIQMIEGAKINKYELVREVQDLRDHIRVGNKRIHYRKIGDKNGN